MIIITKIVVKNKNSGLFDNKNLELNMDLHILKSPNTVYKRTDKMLK